MRDIHHNIGTELAIAPAAYDADHTGPAIDRIGFNGVALAIMVGVGGVTFNGSNKIEFKLQHSDAADSGFEAVSQADVQGVTVATGGIVRALTAAHAEPSRTRLGYVGPRRYVRLFADFSGTHGTPTPLSALAILGSPNNAPVA
ncbi:MAG: hypothetical protein EA385_00500 [Salinarimonadaceae bacterium]|nr:MAG: hypothetical protein EA385_00500 [Salinarimonadaceae bacterium]